MDVLLLGGLEHRSERLTLPHPDLTARRFVLEPLLELDPAPELPDGTRAGARGSPTWPTSASTRVGAL